MAREIIRKYREGRTDLKVEAGLKFVVRDAATRSVYYITPCSVDVVGDICYIHLEHAVLRLFEPDKGYFKQMNIDPWKSEDRQKWYDFKYPPDAQLPLL